MKNPTALLLVTEVFQFASELPCQLGQGAGGSRDLQGRGARGSSLLRALGDSLQDSCATKEVVDQIEARIRADAQARAPQIALPVLLRRRNPQRTQIEARHAMRMIGRRDVP